MFSVLFEVHPRTERFDAYLGYAKLLKPELERVDGFVDNVRYRSLTREGWILSVSGWRDEKALVRWRTHAMHHGMQAKGRDEIFRDYRLRVGQVIRDTRLPEGQRLREQRLDETEAGSGTTATLIDARRDPAWVKEAGPQGVARWLGHDGAASALVSWDVFDGVLAPGDVVLLGTFREEAAAEAFEARVCLPEGARVRRVRIVRDYGMFDRREAPQYYPEVGRPGAQRD